MSKRPLTTAELEQHLDEQLQFLEASSGAFDAGMEGEAKRLAVTLRVLLHDTSKSHSLLGLLGKKDVQFIDTAMSVVSDSIMPHGGLVFVAVGPPRTRYVAMLDDVPEVKRVDFDTWWNAPVFIDERQNTLSRRDLVLTAANQDGGAHVDPKLDITYDALARNNSLGWYTFEEGISRPMAGPERAAIRQIAHEVTKTLMPGYSKKPKHEAAFIAGGMTLVSSPSPPQPARPDFGRKVGRNETCPCGSGKKYKRCCGSV